MEPGSNVSVGNEVAPKGVENAPERIPSSGTRVKRPKLWEDKIAELVKKGSSRVRPLVAAGLVALGGAGLANDAHAQQTQENWANQPTTWGARQGGINVSLNSPHFGRDLARAVIASAVIEAISPRQYQQILSAPNSQPFSFSTTPGADAVMGNLNLRYDVLTSSMLKVDRATGAESQTGLKFGPNTKVLNIRKADDTHIFIDNLYTSYIVQGGRQQVILMRDTLIMTVTPTGNIQVNAVKRRPYDPNEDQVLYSSTQ